MSFTVDQLIQYLQTLSDTGKGGYRVEFQAGGALCDWDIVSDRIDVDSKRKIVLLEQEW